MQKAEEIHQFRQYRARILSIRDIDQEERVKLKDEVLDMYGEMRVSSVVHPATFAKLDCGSKKKADLLVWVERSLNLWLYCLSPPSKEGRMSTYLSHSQPPYSPISYPNRNLSYEMDVENHWRKPLYLSCDRLAVGEYLRIYLFARSIHTE